MSQEQMKQAMGQLSQEQLQHLQQLRQMQIREENKGSESFGNYLRYMHQVQVAQGKALLGSGDPNGNNHGAQYGRSASMM